MKVLEYVINVLKVIRNYKYFLLICFVIFSGMLLTVISSNEWYFYASLVFAVVFEYITGNLVENNPESKDKPKPDSSITRRNDIEE